MARDRWVQEIVESEYPQYNVFIRQFIDRAVRKFNCEDTSDVALDFLWASAPDDVAVILDSDGDLAPTTDRPLTAEERETLRAFIEKVRAFEHEVQDSTSDEISRMHAEKVAPLVELERNEAARASRERDRWAFFNHPDARADFSQWRQRHLSPEQATALLLGKDPRVVTHRSMTRFKSVGPSQFKDTYFDLLSTIQEHISRKSLLEPILLDRLLVWAGHHGYDLPTELDDAPKAIEIERLEKQIEDVQGELDKAHRRIAQLLSSAEDLPESSLTLQYKIIVAMAKEKFEHKGTGSSKAAAAIHSAVTKDGFTADQSSVRNLLTKADAFLDPKRVSPVETGRLKVPREPKSVDR
jgi:hypothetical protein